jgi:hypothetical protein
MTNTPNQTLVNEFDELTALALKDYEAATVEFGTIVAKAKTLYGAARAAYQMENKPKRDELVTFINIYDNEVVPAHNAVKTAAAQGDLDTLEKEGEKLVDGLEALAELSPDLAERFRSLESGVTSLKKNDPVQDARLDHIEKHLLEAGGYVPYGTTPPAAAPVASVPVSSANPVSTPTKELPVVPAVPQAPHSVTDVESLAAAAGTTTVPVKEPIFHSIRTWLNSRKAAA